MTDHAKELRRVRADMLGTEDEEHYWACHAAAAEIDRLVAEGAVMIKALAAIGYESCVGYSERDLRRIAVDALSRIRSRPLYFEGVERLPASTRQEKNPDPPWDEFTPPWCRGSTKLGTGCGTCDKCKWEKGEWRV